MRYFVTGASGWIGSAVSAELIAAGHEVVGLARSDEGAARVEAMGAIVLRGDLEDHDSLRAGAEGADGIVHCGFIHDFSNFEKSVGVDAAAVSLFGDLLEGSGKPLVIASGILGFAKVETDRFDGGGRMATENMLLGFKDRGIRSTAVRLAPTVHGKGDHGFIASMIGFDRETGVAAYVGDNTWPAVHRLDAAHLFCLALEKAPGGTVVHAIAEPAVSLKAVAEIVGAGLDLPVKKVSAEEAPEYFSWLGRFLAIGWEASSEWTQKEFGWTPTHPTLLEDLREGSYF